MVKLGFKDVFSLTLNEISEQKELLSMVAYFVTGFLVTFLFKRPQELIFLFTNLLIVMAALNLKGKRLLPVIVIPTIGALIGSYVFGDATFIIISFMPIVWISELILVTAIKWIYLYKNINFFISLFVGATIKYLLLAVSAYLFIINNLAPNVFMLSFGRIQLITAVLGGAIAYFVVKNK